MGRNFFLDFQPGWLILTAVSLLVLPLRWVFALLLAQIIHEACHILALRMMKSDLREIRFGFAGAEIVTLPLEPRQELLCAAAGPAGSFLMLAFLKVYPELSFCALVQGLYNLLPLYPSDGGRVLRCALELLCPRHTDRVMKHAAVFTVLTVMALGCTLVVLFPRWFLFVLIPVVFLLFDVFRKFPCKERAFELQ